jgi:hypothetical protein
MTDFTWHPDMHEVTRKVAAENPTCPMVLQIIGADGEVSALAYSLDEDNQVRAQRHAEREQRGGATVQLFSYH